MQLANASCSLYVFGEEKLFSERDEFSCMCVLIFRYFRNAWGFLSCHRGAAEEYVLGFKFMYADVMQDKIFGRGWGIADRSFFGVGQGHGHS